MLSAKGNQTIASHIRRESERANATLNGLRFANRPVYFPFLISGFDVVDGQFSQPFSIFMPIKTWNSRNPLGQGTTMEMKGMLMHFIPTEQNHIPKFFICVKVMLSIIAMVISVMESPVLPRSPIKWTPSR